MSDTRKPKIGEQIYVPSSLNVYKGSKDFSVELVAVELIDHNKQFAKDDYNYTFISKHENIKENDGAKYNWNWILENQEMWMVLYNKMKED